MSTQELQKISNDLYSLLICLNKKIFNPEHIIKGLPLPPSHIKVIFYLDHHNKPSVSSIAKYLSISKSNMTPIIDKLIKEGYVTRFDDPNDRRIIRITLTDKGNEFLEEQKHRFKEILTEKISCLTPEELSKLSMHTTGITDLISKLD